jgi:SOS-response transcriptional repressor LexA
MTAAFGLTPRDRQALDFIRAYSDEHGQSPTFQQIATALGMRSKSNISRIVDDLVERGHLRRKPNKHRSLMPVEQGLRQVAPAFVAALPDDLRRRLQAFAARHRQAEVEALVGVLRRGLDSFEGRVDKK